MSFKSFGLVRAVEEEMETVATPGVETEEVDVAPEVVEDSAEIADGVDAADSVAADVDTIEEIKDVLEEAADKGEGIDETAAKVAEIAVESIAARLQISSGNLFAGESFASSRGRVTATRMAAEGLGDMAKRAWEAVVEFVKKIWQKVKDFFKGLFNKKEALRNRIRSVRKLVDKKGINRTRKFTGKEAETLGQLLQGTSGAADLVSKTTEMYKAIITRMETLNGSGAGSYSVVLKALKDAAESDSSNKADVASKLAALVTAVTGNATIGSKAGDFAPYSANTVLGGVVFGVAVEKEGSAEKGEFTLPKFRFVDKKDIKNISTDVEVISNANATTYLKDLEALVSTIEKYEKTTANMDKLTKEAEAFEKRATGKSPSKADKTAMQVIRLVGGFTSKASVSPVANAMKSGFALCNYIAKCTKAVEEEERD